jgi:GT2 family glycosyltransferase
MSDKLWARIIIVAFNSGEVLQNCIDHLSCVQDPDFEVVIVDNNPTDGSTDNLSLPNDRFKVLKSEKNNGFSGGSNLGAEGADTEWIFTLNPDAFVSENWINECKLAVKKFPNCGMISPLLLNKKDPGIIDGCGDVLSLYGHSWRGGHQQAINNAPQGYCQVFAPSGACAGYRRDIFQKASGFDSSFFCYKEDVDLGLRLNRMGEICIYVPKAIVHHIGSSTLKDRHPLILYHSYRNNIFMIAKNFPVINLIIALPVFTTSVLWIILRNLKLEGNIHILKGLTVGLFLTPFLISKRIFNSLFKKSEKSSLYYPMNSSRNDLRKSSICNRALKY